MTRPDRAMIPSADSLPGMEHSLGGLRKCRSVVPVDIWNGLDEVPSDLQGSVVTIGVFDVVHRGHQTLIDTAVTKAREFGVPAVMMTFDPHPTVIFLPKSVPPLLATVEQRAVSAARYGIDAMLVVAFDDEIISWSPEEYFRRVIVDLFKAKAVVVGDNFTFGSQASGTSATMKELGERYGVDVTVHGLLRDGDGTDGHTVCSSWIREQLAAGNVAGAAGALGRNFTVRGVVTRGAGRGGAALGFPTANLYFPDSQALPADGVYAGDLRILPTQKDPVGALVGVLSSVIPYSCELVALRSIRPAVFGILMSLEPAAAALAAIVVLQEFLTPVQWLAVGCVVAASVGATRGMASRRRAEQLPGTIAT